MNDREPSILHVDMDAFYASVELLRRPELRGQPVVVGGSGERGVVAAASYEARAYGIHSAMSSVQARRRCPHAVFLAGDHAHYSEVSRRVMAIFRSFTPVVEPLSLDEAFLDVSGVRRLHGSPTEIAHRLRREVFDREGLTCAVGVARAKFLAKLASQAAKPRPSRNGTVPGPGVLLVEPDRELEFLHPMPVSALWGVGPVTAGKLERLGVRTVGHLAETPIDLLAAHLGEASGRHLHALSNAVDPRAVQPDLVAKSVGHEETFARDLFRMDDLRVELLRMCDAVASRLNEGATTGRTITVKVRFADFSTVTRSHTLDSRTRSARTIAEVARRLLDQLDPAKGVRLLGVHVSQLGTDAARQLTFDDLLDDGPEEWTRAEAAVHAIRARFGDRAVGPASLTGTDGLRIARRGAQQWGPTGAPKPSSTDRED